MNAAARERLARLTAMMATARARSERRPRTDEPSRLVCHPSGRSHQTASRGYMYRCPECSDYADYRAAIAAATPVPQR